RVLFRSPYGHFAALAPVLIVPAYRKECAVPEFAQVDMSIAQENMWLETDSLGLGGVWLGTAPLEERMKMVEGTLQLPDTVRAFAVFALGYPAETRPQQDRFDESRIHYVK
uniref:nitroreductase family protein n=1 Tax=uncultured Eubacterium sp. TaxID=165185 RepID=UPI0026728481